MFEMIYINFKRCPCPCMSVSDTNLPPENDFRILVVARPTLGFLVLALTALPINGAVALIAGFRNSF